MLFRSEEEVESSFETDPPTAEELVAPPVLAVLPPLSVTSPTGSKVSLEFEDVGESTVDALLDEGSVILDGVSHLKVDEDSKEIHLYDGSEWHSFGFRKLPKAWVKVLNPGVLYGVDDGEDKVEE